MRNILSQLLINELDQLTSSVLHGNLHYDGEITNLAEIQRLMGHSSSATTFGYIRNVHHDKIKISPRLGLQGDEKLK